MYRIFIIALAFSSIAFAEDYKWTDDCDKNQSSMNSCAADKFKFYDQRLNEVYAEQMKHLQDGKHKSYLKDAQRAWVVFRDKDCTYVAGKSEDSGSIWALEHFLCLAERTKTRIYDIEKYVACRENGCPY